MKSKRKGIKTVLIIIVVIIVVIVAGGFFLRMSSDRNDLIIDDLDMELESSVSSLLDKDKSIRNCVLAVRKGDDSYSWSGAAGIAYQDSQVPMTASTPVYISSVTKLYTAVAIMKLYEAGVLSLNDTISKYLPADLIKGIHVYQGKDYSGEITIKQLLSHSSGLADYYTEKAGDGKNLFELLVENPEKSWTIEETITRVRDDLEPHFPPGTGAFYSDTNFQLLGLIIEKLTSKPLYLVFEDFFFHPLGLKHTWLSGYSEIPDVRSAIPADVFYKETDITGIRSNSAYWADGGIVSTAEEMVIFLKALNEGKIITKKALALMHHWRKLSFPMQYGYGTMYFKLPQSMGQVTGLTPLWGHSGSTGSFLYYSENLDLYLAGSLNNADSDTKPFFTIISDVMKLFDAERKTGTK